jgi:hypothetical protein
MTLPAVTTDKTLRIYLTLMQYPILGTQIRARMRREIFQRGIITQPAFEVEVNDYAIRTQAREAVHNPLYEESAEIWDLRLQRVRDHLTEFYFAHNLPFDLFEAIVRETLTERGAGPQDLLIAFNPELASQDMLFEQAAAIEKLPDEARTKFEARLREIKVVLIRTLISDQLAYVNIAKDWFTIGDLAEIRRRRIGQGKIGGKAAGMLLAQRILKEVGDEDIRQHLRIPESYYLGADLTYTFMAISNLMTWSDQKYKTEEQIRADFPNVRRDFMAGQFPVEAVEKFQELLAQVGRRSLIVRSSSLLEDNFGTSFAGKYESHFCPNQGSPAENLHDLTTAIKRIYASIFNPDALLYRRARGLQDYDERMAVLIQTVEGQPFGRYFMPQAAGVAFSHNLFRWSPEIRREDGFMRLVWGLGTRAVDRVGNDYPRLVALSHPLLRPESSPTLTRRYSQQFVDVIDLEANQFASLPVSQVLTTRYPGLRYVVQHDQGGYLATLHSSLLEGSVSDLVVTYDELLRRTPLADRMRRLLQTLEKHYRAPVDTEFTAQVLDPQAVQPEVEITLVQCRPQSHLKDNPTHLPQSLYEGDIVFATTRVVPEGRVSAIQYVVFVPPEAYYALPTNEARSNLGRAIGRLNKVLEGRVFICVGPGRWGTSNPELGVHIGYADIYNTRALVEITGGGIGLAPEPSFGTHFFQDLVESNIFPLAVHLDDAEAIFNRAFFYDTSNCLEQFLPHEKAAVYQSLRLIEVAAFRPGHRLELVMDDERGKAAAFLVLE